jgi:hypothetical protein
MCLLLTDCIYFLGLKIYFFDGACLIFLALNSSRLIQKVIFEGFKTPAFGAK